MQFVGPLPAEIQNFTVYAAEPASQSEAALAFVCFLGTPAAKETFVAAGVEGIAFLLISIPKLFAAPISDSKRGPVYYHRSKNLLGVQLLPTSTPLPSYAYPLLVATFIGRIWTLFRERA